MEEQIFNSNVDPNLQLELNARAKAGIDRTNKSLDYMIGKVANVAVLAHKDNTHNNDPSNIEYILGGKTILSDDYMTGPILSGNTEYRKNNVINSNSSTYVGKTLPETIIVHKRKLANNINRVGPFITGAEISLNDNSYGLTNSATIKFVIPNPKRDLDYMESVFFRPVRPCTLVIESPKSSIITGNKLKGTRLHNNIGTDKNKDMNRLETEMNIISFTFSYATNGSVIATINLIGKSDSYANLPLTLMPISKQNDAVIGNVSEVIVPDFYTSLYNLVEYDITRLHPNYNAYNLQPRESIDGNSSINLTATDVKWSLLNTITGNHIRYITLGLLIEFINTHIIIKIKDVINDAKIICNDKICVGNINDAIVSADPMNVWLRGSNYDLYATHDENGKWCVTSKNPNHIANFEDNTNNSVNTLPSRIYISLNAIHELLKPNNKYREKYSVISFLSDIHDLISSNTGGFVNMNLLSHPDDIKTLLYYNASYKVSETNNVKPFNVPMVVKSIETVGTTQQESYRGSIVRNFTFDAKLPAEVQQMMAAFNQRDPSSKDPIVPYMNNMYGAIEVTRSGRVETISLHQGVVEEYNKEYSIRLTTLKDAKRQYILNKGSDTTKIALKDALLSYMQYPASSIALSARTHGVVYPFTAEFTIDGINGFRYGDILEFDVLPSKYKKNTVFVIIGVNHTVSETGDWQTTIKCQMKPI